MIQAHYRDYVLDFADLIFIGELFMVNLYNLKIGENLTKLSSQCIVFVF